MNISNAALATRLLGIARRPTVELSGQDISALAEAAARLANAEPREAYEADPGAVHARLTGGGGRGD